MAIVFIDGFDSYQIAFLPRKWNTVTDGDSSFLMETSAPRTGNQSLKFQLSDSITYNLYTDEHTAIKIGAQSVTIGFAIKLPGNPASAVTVAKAIWTAPTAQTYELKIDAAGDLTVTNGTATTVYTTFDNGEALDLTDGSWHYIEVHFRNNDVAADDHHYLQVDNKFVGQSTSGTAEAAGTALVAVSLHGTINDQLIDDVYIGNGDETEFPGGAKVLTMMPNEAGFFVGWTPSDNAVAHYTLVDEETTTFPDDDATFVEALQGLLLQDSYRFENPPSSDEPEWSALQLSACIKNLGSGTTEVKGFHYDTDKTVNFMDVPQHPAGTYDHDIASQSTYTYLRWMGPSSMNNTLDFMAAIQFGLEAV